MLHTYASYTPRGWINIEVYLEIKYQPWYSYTEAIQKKQTCKHCANDLHTNSALKKKTNKFSFRLQTAAFGKINLKEVYALIAWN